MIEPDVRLGHPLPGHPARRDFRGDRFDAESLLGSHTRSVRRIDFGLLHRLLPLIGPNRPNLLKELFLRHTLETPDFDCPAGQQAQDSHRERAVDPEEDVAAFGEVLKSSLDPFGRDFMSGRQTFEAALKASCDDPGTADAQRRGSRIDSRLNR